jgi:hypothetical protein
MIQENNFHVFEYISKFLDKSSLAKDAKMFIQGIHQFSNSAQNTLNFFMKMI